MKRPTTGFVISALLLALSSTIVVLTKYITLENLIPFQWWIHLVLLALLFVGLRELHKSKSSPGVSVTGFLSGFPIWLGLVAIPVLVLVLPAGAPSNFDLGKTPSGEIVHRKSWREDNAHFYLRLNNGPEVEISTTEYQALQNDLHCFFARLWTLFSYVSLVLWQYLKRLTLQEAMNV